MSYPQPNSNKPALLGQSFYRLRTQLTSAGDIYESEQGAQAIYVGPDSDIATVGVIYYDDSMSPTFQNQAMVSSNKGMVGLLPARMDANYQPSGRKGRLLYYAADLFDPGYKPTVNASGINDSIIVETPVLDVIQYFSAPTVPTPGRSDKVYKYQQLPALGTQSIIIPIYGRAYASVEITNKSDDIINFGILGVRFAFTDDSAIAEDRLHQETTLTAFANLADNAQLIRVVRPSVDGKFDALVVQVGRVGVSSGLVSLDVYVSDVAQN